MAAPNLDQVDPERRAEVARRIAVLDRYLAIVSPDRADDAAHAEAIGVGIGQFMRLIRIWRRHRRAELLPGARERAAPASKAAHARPVLRDEEASGRVLFDDVALNLPTGRSASRTLPLLHIVFDAEGDDVLAWRLEDRQITEASAARLLLSLPRGGTPLSEASLPALLGNGRLAAALREAAIGVIVRDPVAKLGVEARRITGGRIGGLALRSRAHRRVDAGSTPDAARLSRSDAERAVERAIRTSQDVRPPTVGLPDDDAGARLRGQLAAIAGEEA